MTSRLACCIRHQRRLSVLPLNPASYTIARSEHGQIARRSQLVELREEGTEFGGYFIVNGIERVVRMLIQPRRHYIMASRRSAYRKRGSSYTDAATVLR